MYVKNNFSNYFVLATILIYVLGFSFDHWRMVADKYYSSLTVNLQALALGLYSLFYENGFLNANPYYQVFVIALITSYQTVVRISCIVPQLYFYSGYLGLAWAVLALVLYNKFPNVLNYILQYEIGFSILLYILTSISGFIQCSYNIKLVIVAVISLVFVFISYLTFDRIANYTSTYLFSYMVTKGLILLYYYTPFASPIVFYDDLAFKITNVIVFLVAICYQYNINRPQGILLGSDTPSYGSIENEN